MTTQPPASAPPVAPRVARRRGPPLGPVAVVVGAGLLAGAALVAPDELGALRVLGVGLGWWLTWIALGVALAVVLCVPRDPAGRGSTDGD